MSSIYFDIFETGTIGKYLLERACAIFTIYGWAVSQTRIDIINFMYDITEIFSDFIFLIKNKKKKPIQLVIGNCPKPFA